MTAFNRRSFLRLSGGVASSALVATGLGGLPLVSGCSRRQETDSGTAAAGGTGNPFGIQLYTLRDVLPENPEAIIRQLASFGYNLIESYEGPAGIFWGMGNIGFKQLMDDLGMKMIASHVNNFDDFESFARKADEAAAIGMKYLICPYARQDSLDEYRALAERFNRAGEIAQQAGIGFAYHNHDYSFQKLEGEYPQDLLMQNTDTDLVDYELDIYWAAVANEDPATWLRKYPNRFVLSHVKDLKRNGGPQSTVVGQGEIDWASLLPIAKAQGMEYFIVEQEQYEGTTPVDAARDSAIYMQHLQY